jgi:hypothetical protein
MSETVQLVLILCITFVAITVMNNLKGWWKK